MMSRQSRQQRGVILVLLILLAVAVGATTITDHRAAVRATVLGVRDTSRRNAQR